MAAEIHVMSAGAVKAAVTELAKDFQKEKGDEVKFTFATVGALQQKIAAGERAERIARDGISRPKNSLGQMVRFPSLLRGRAVMGILESRIKP
jgi:ABC-type molybdate transport system substrate-binding protein